MLAQKEREEQCQCVCYRGKRTHPDELTRATTEVAVTLVIHREDTDADTQQKFVHVLRVMARSHPIAQQHTLLLLRLLLLLLTRGCARKLCKNIAQQTHKADHKTHIEQTSASLECCHCTATNINGNCARVTTSSASARRRVGEHSERVA